MLRESKHTFDTPDLVSVDYEIVGLGSRFVGIALDTMVIQCVVMVLVLVAVLILQVAGLFDSLDFVGQTVDTLSKAAVAVMLILYFVLIWGYHVFFETTRHGRTPGKKLAGIQVIKLDGGPISFRDSMIRNLLRIADYLPVFYTAGAVSILASKNGQRLGDMAAGTVVIRNTGTSYLDGRKDADRRLDIAGIPAPAAAGDTPPISDREFELVMNFLKRADSFDADRRLNLAFQIAHRIGRRYSVPLERYHRSPEHFLREIVSGK